MSGIASGIGKIFTGVAQTASKVSQAVMGVGATAFTAGAAAKAAPMASGGLGSVIEKMTGGGVLGNMLSGAVKQAGYGALIGGAAGALTGQGFGKGAMIGGLGGAVSGGLMGAAGLGAQSAANQPSAGVDGIVTGSTPTGMDATGRPAPLSDQAFSDRFNATGGQSGPAVDPTRTASTATPGKGGFWNFVQSPMGGNIIAGLGQGLAAGMQAKQQAEEAEKDRRFVRDREQRLQDSYNIDPSAMPGAVSDGTPRPTPAQRWARTRYEYDPAAGRIVSVPI